MTYEELNQLISSGARIALDIGCGPSRKAGYLGVDKMELPGVDIVADMENGLGFLPDNSVDEIYSSNFVEHIANLETFLRECHRVVKKGGMIHIIVPHFANPWFYSDYTHQRFFGLYTFLYFAEEGHLYRREIPKFYTDFKFRIISQKLIFKSPGFWLRNLIKQVFQRFFNLSIYLQELYEDVFVYYFPCQEVVIRMTPSK